VPDFAYAFSAVGPCPAGPGGALAGFPNPISIPFVQLFNAQLRLGAYPAGWALDEMCWRVLSLAIGITPLAAVPPLFPPALAGFAPGVAMPVPGMAANLPPSPVALAVDSTERGQVAYHVGTAVGGALSEYLPIAGGGFFPAWFDFHLTRAQANGGVFTFQAPPAPQTRPDVVMLGLTFAPGGGWNVNNFIVWENKGRTTAVGPGVLAAARLQASRLTAMTTLPAVAAAAAMILAAPRAPDNYVASVVDVNGGNFRIRTRDPSGPPSGPIALDPGAAGRFLRGYYAPFVEAIRASSGSVVRSYGGRRFRMIELPKQVCLGVDTEILSALQRSSSTEADEIGAVLSRGYQVQSPDIVHIHATGIATELPRRWSSRASERQLYSIT